MKSKVNATTWAREGFYQSNIESIYTITILPYKIEECTLPYRPLDDVCVLCVAPAPCHSHLPTVETTPVPPSQTIGVLFFPLSSPSLKGATHSPDSIPSFPARLQG